MQTEGFPPISAPDAKVLILGTLPGQLSLQKCEYYGHPRNAFWGLMGELFGALPELPYAERKRRIVAARVAIWDVCATAHRPGSLDTSIDPASIRANDFKHFLALHKDLVLIGFNGHGAERLYRRLVLPKLASASVLRYETLPSTSPANASMTYAEKLRHWSIVRAVCCADAP